MIKEIKDRHSIRKYKDDSVNKEDIKKIIEAAILAPSAKNRQPWKYIVFEGAKKDESPNPRPRKNLEDIVEFR